MLMALCHQQQVARLPKGVTEWRQKMFEDSVRERLGVAFTVHNVCLLAPMPFGLGMGEADIQGAGCSMRQRD